MPSMLAELRRARVIAQRGLARALGLSHGAIGNYVSGVASPSLRTARKIAAFFGVRLDEIEFAGEREAMPHMVVEQDGQSDSRAREEAAE